jgi:hypothetical protein
MAVSERELRAFVYQEVARHLGRRASAKDAPEVQIDHVSHLRLSIARGAGTGEACLIEPSVRCNNCGYCQSYGH